jgi:hypothetical protein
MRFIWRPQTGCISSRQTVRIECREPSKTSKAKLSLHNEKGSFMILKIIGGTIGK